MTNRVYTPQELAELVATHDREHPDHKVNCGCQNGVIQMLRTYFGPSGRRVPEGPLPYLPPDRYELQPRPTRDARKPWMLRREGETKDQHDWRISHSCYNCGAVIADPNLLNDHEDECATQGKPATATAQDLSDDGR